MFMLEWDPWSTAVITSTLIPSFYVYAPRINMSNLP